MQSTNEPGDVDDLEFLVKAADILFNLHQIDFGVPAGSKDGKPRCVIIAEHDLAWWEERRTSVRRACSAIGKCADLRCRRRQRCQKLERVTLEVEASRARLAAWQAASPAAVRPPDPPPAGNKKGRTGVRP